MIFRLKQLRTERGLTLDQLAEVSGLSKGFLSQLETGARQPSTDTLRTLSQALDVTEADLIATPGFADPAPKDTMARRVLSSIDSATPAATEPDFKLGTDGKQVQIIATVDKDGLDKLIRQLEAMRLFLNA